MGRAWAGTARRWPDVLLGRAGPWFQVLGPARHGPVKFRALSARHGSARSTMGPCRAGPARPNFQLYRQPLTRLCAPKKLRCQAAAGARPIISTVLIFVFGFFAELTDRYSVGRPQRTGRRIRAVISGVIACGEGRNQLPGRGACASDDDDVARVFRDPARASNACVLRAMRWQ